MQPPHLPTLLAFIHKHPIGPHPHSPALINRFFSTLTSGPHNIIQTHHKNQKLVSLLLDNITNTAHCAGLEILGGQATIHTIGQALEKAKPLTPKTFNGYHVTIPHRWHARIAQRHGLQPAYHTFHMTNSPLKPHPTNPNLTAFIATDADTPAIYQLLKLSFDNNPELSLSTEAEWTRNRHGRPTPHTWVIRQNNHPQGLLLAFLTTNPASTAGVTEINMLGTHPKARGQGMAKHLLATVLNHLHQTKSKGAELTVSTLNTQALKLYQSLGFQAQKPETTYTYHRPR